MRLPGSIHRKNPTNPKPCRFVEHNPDAEIVLEDALAELEGIAIQRGIYEREAQPRADFSGSPDPTGDAELLLACAERIPNADLEWAAWNRLGMAFWRAS